MNQNLPNLVDDINFSNDADLMNLINGEKLVYALKVKKANVH